MPKHSHSNIPQSVRPATGAFRPAYQAPDGAYARNASAYRQTAKSASRTKRIAIIVATAVLVLLIGAGTAFAMYMGYISDQLNRGDKTDEELIGIDDALGYSTSLDKPFYMLLIGSDKREGNSSMGARSDTNIVARVDPEADLITMVSIPRDTKIEIEGHGTQKFNAAYAFDGAAGTIEAAEELLDIEIAHYAEVNFGELAALVDAVGGVTVENESKIDNWKCDDGDGNHYVIDKGTVHLSGGEALTFARNRDYPDGDFTRQMHQRAVIEAVVDNVLELPITAMPGVIEAAAKCVTTDLSAFDIIGLAQMFAEADDLIIYSAMLPSYTQTINGISFVINDEEKTVEMMELVEAGEDPSEIVSTMTAPAIVTDEVDTSNTIIWDDDEESVVAPVEPSASAPASSAAASSGGATAESPASSSGNAGTQPSSPSAQPSSSSSAASAGGAASSGGTASAGAGNAASEAAPAAEPRQSDQQ